MLNENHKIKLTSLYLKKAMSFPCFRRTGLSGADEEFDETDNLCNFLTEGTIGNPGGTLSPITFANIVIKYP
jgi:hypothetical protein